MNKKTKWCATCRQEKPIEAFYTSGRGVLAGCRSCRYKAVKAWREKNPEKAKQLQRGYYSRHAEERRAYNRDYYRRKTSADN